MLNLLFISSLPKASALRDILQPQLKAKIDLAEDFDLGLKSVFEKRPAIVVIQEYIAGVSGESVVRHIQMLLGDEAPRFLLLTDGGTNSQAAAGLFPFQFGGDVPENQLAEQILEALKQMFGEQWWGMLVSPGKSASPEERAVADTMVSDLLSEIKEPVANLPSMESPEIPFGEPGVQIRTNTDEMASLLVKANLEAAQEAARSSSPPVPVMEQLSSERPAETADLIHKKSGTTSPESGRKQTPTPADSSSPSINEVHRAQTAPVQKASVRRAASPEVPAPDQPRPKPAPHVASVARSMSAKSSVPPSKQSSPAAFQINAGPAPEKEPIPEELLLEFEKNFRSQSKGMRNLLVACIAVCVLGGGAWWWFSQKPATVKSGTAVASRPAKDLGGQETAAAPTPPPSVPTPSPGPTPSSSSSAPRTTVVRPSFLPAQWDTSFSQTRPGWERYTDSDREVRIYRAGERIKAVQVMAARGKIIDQDFFSTVLRELTGSSDHTLGKAEKKKGYRDFLVQHGTAGEGAELVVYRKRSPDGLVAFVVSLK